MGLIKKENRSILHGSLKVCLEGKQSKSYEIFIGYNIFDRIARMNADSNIAAHYVIVKDECVCPLYGETLLAYLKKMTVKSDLIVFPAGERSKNLQSVIDLTSKMLDLSVDRKSALIALGGGVVGDLTGYIASVYMRGVPLIQVPTTLIAQVDNGVMSWSRTFLKEAQVSIGAVFRKTSGKDSIRDKCLFDFRHPRQEEANSVSLRSCM